MRKAVWLLALGVAFTAGCAAGPEGPMGPAGPAGVPGISLLQEYTGTMAAADLDVDVPDILNRRQNTFVEVFRQAAGNDTVWEPVSDGYSETTSASPRYLVSWSSGTVYLRGFAVGEKYLIKVFENQ